MARVLVVDDEPPIRMLLSRLLQTSGHEVEEAENALRALEIMKARPAAVVFCDVLMPGQDGLWLTHELREQYPNVAVILATGVANVPPRVSMQSGVVAYLVKPFRATAVLNALAAAMKWTEETLRYEATKHEPLAPMEQGLASLDHPLPEGSEQDSDLPLPRI